jgi:hypothetical protein
MVLLFLNPPICLQKQAQNRIKQPLFWAHQFRPPASPALRLRILAHLHETPQTTPNSVYFRYFISLVYLCDLRGEGFSFYVLRFYVLFVPFPFLFPVVFNQRSRKPPKNAIFHNPQSKI